MELPLPFPHVATDIFLIPNLKTCDLLDGFLIHNSVLLIRLPCSMGKFVCGPLDLIAHGHFIMLMAGKGQKHMENHILLPLIPTVWPFQTRPKGPNF